MHSLLRDLRYGIRSLLQRPGFTIVAVLTLALGIGVNAALFTVFDAFVLKPLPLKDPDSLININGFTAQGEPQRLFSYLDYLSYREQSQTLSDLVAWNKVRAAVGEAPPTQDDSSPFTEGYEFLFGQMVTSNYFSALRAEMSLGRMFQPEDDSEERAVLVLSHSCWERRFASDPAIVGKTIKLQGQTFTIVGVTSKDFIGTSPDVPAFWAPLTTRDLLIQAGGWGNKVWRTDRDTNVFTMLGRLKTGMTVQSAQAEFQLINERLKQTFPSEDRAASVKLESAATFVTLNEDVMPLVLPLLLGFGLVLTIACANVANLVLARSAGRHREIAVRQAVGATRWHIVRQLVTESVLLALAGGVVGLLLAAWTLSALYPIVLSTVPLPDGLTSSFSLNLTPDWRVFLFTLLLASVAGIGAGLIPALQVSKPNLGPALKNEGSTLGQQFSQSRLRSVFVVLQVALCMSLLAAAGLLAHNLQRVKTIDTGMSTTNVFSVAVGLSSSDVNKTDARAGDLRRQLADRLRSTPGVLAVAETHQQPLSGGIGNTAVLMPGQSSEHPLEARFNFVSPEYFEALNISLTRGRHFTPQEAGSHAPMIVISEATAQRYWPGVNPLGQHLGIAVNEQPTEPQDQEKQTNFRQYEVIGVTRDARSRWVWEKDETLLYLPLSPNSSKGQFLLVHTQADPGGVMGSVRDLATSIDPSLRTASRRISDDMSFQMAPFRVVAWLSGTLGLLALLLASIGLYGVMAFVVTQRTREIGIRVALGAQPKAVVKMFVVQGLRLTLMGIVGGVIGGALISRLLTSVLIDLSPFDVVAFGSVAAFLTSVALLAIFIPARRAAHVDPLIALRYE